jgi:DegV family protein with EDD domain
MSIRIVTDSTCDLPNDIIERLGITIIPAYINMGDHSYLDGVELTRREFYDQLPSLHTPPTTSAPGIGTFIKVYEQLAVASASEIISIHISEKLSNIANVAQLAAQAVQTIDVTVFDSGQVTLGTGLLVQIAAEAAAAGKSISEIIHLLHDKRAKTYCYAALDTLEYLRRSGRVSFLQAGLGSVLQIKPILKMHAGVVEMDRARTRTGAMERLVDLLKAVGSIDQISLVHSGAPERAQVFWDSIKQLFPTGTHPLSVEVTSVIGTHIGPGAVGLVCIKSDDHQSAPEIER